MYLPVFFLINSFLLSFGVSLKIQGHAGLMMSVYEKLVIKFFGRVCLPLKQSKQIFLSHVFT